MKKLVLLLVLAFPLMSLAQHDDIYFVPTKEKKVVIVTDADNVVLLDDEEYYYEDEYAYDEYTTGDAYLYDNEDYLYSTRLLRFRSPNGYMGSNLYWDLIYNSGMNDWTFYDDGYYINVYPTYSNPVYYWPTYRYNHWSWNSWYYPNYSWNYNYWGYHCHPSYIWHSPHHGHHIAHNSWRPAHKVYNNIPLNKGPRKAGNIVSNNSNRRPSAAVNNHGRPVVNRNSGQTSNRVVPAGSNGRVNSTVRDNAGRPTTVNRQQPQRVVNGANSTQKGSNVRPQQPYKSSAQPAVKRSEGSKVPSTNVRTTNQRSSRPSSSSSSGERSSYRSNDSSSREYNRPSSTSVSRQRSSTSGSSSASPRTGVPRSSSGNVGAGASGGARR